MPHRNNKEYVLMRQELLGIKNCITTYMGFVIVGSAAALYGLAAVNTTERLISLSYAPLALSFLISLVLFILFYKFTSHNRMAGYCKLLNFEKADKGHKQLAIYDIYSWEVCLDELRNVQLDAAKLLQPYAKEKIIINADCQKLIGFLEERNKAESDIKGWKKCMGGLMFLIPILSTRVETSSWGFPPNVVKVFFSLSAIFISIGTYFSLSYSFWNDTHDNKRVALLAILVITIVVQVAMWLTFCKKLYRLMKGDRTIDSFCWKFLPPRYEFMRGSGFHPEYILKI